MGKKPERNCMVRGDLVDEREREGRAAVAARPPARAEAFVMDTFRFLRVTPAVCMAATAVLAASFPFAVEADESILKRVVGGVTSRRDDGPVARLHRRIEERPAHRNDYQDGLVVHAGGSYAGQFDSLEGHGKHAGAGCRGGRCDDQCVVRPDRFGFYETQWRQWPGLRVVQATAAEELTPASPPRLRLPDEKEESLDPKAAVEFGVDEPPEDSDATTLPGLGPAVPRPQPKPPAAEPKLPAVEPKPPAVEPVIPARPAGPKPPEPPPKPAPQDDAESEPKPEVKPPAVPARPSANDNLFDEASHRRRLQERLAVIRSEARAAGVPPVPFPEAETARPVAEGTSMFQERVPEAADTPAAAPAVKPVVYDHEPGAKDPNPLRTSRDRGWRARLVE